MKNHELIKTNLIISIILVIGFAITALFSYKANYNASLDNIEQVSSLTTEGIYYQLTTRFTKPVNISLTMSRDSLLVDHLQAEPDHLEDPGYIETIRQYLSAYREKYGFDSVFLVSTKSSRYYNFNGLDRTLVEGDPENVWYYTLLDSDKEYELVVDNDEVDGADNAITVFVNCKIFSEDHQVLGVVGVGIRISYLKDLLLSYEEKYNLHANLVDAEGTIQISTTYTGYEKTNWFEVNHVQKLETDILSWEDETSNLELWSSYDDNSSEKSYIVTRYIPELSWHLIVQQDTGKLVSEIKGRFYGTFLLIVGVILIVLVVITTVIRNFNRQITQLIEERQAVFKKATEQLYDNIYELNITKNCYVGERTKQYFESVGSLGLPFDQVLSVIAQKQIKEEFREGYVRTFTPENVIKQYENGNNHLQYDFMTTQDGTDYFWMRIDAYIFHSSEDDCIHMFVYRKNIDAEKQKQRQFELKASTDEMTGFYTKKATERIIDQLLDTSPKQHYAFFIFDIDIFKQANDLYGHAFGDLCIREFTGIIRSHFRSSDVLGRIGGDEFAAFIPIPSLEWVELKARELSSALDTVCTDGSFSWKMTASIGISIFPADGSDFASLYRKADAALYQTKKRGKNGFTVYKLHDQ